MRSMRLKLRKTKKNQLYYYGTSTRINFVCFLGELKTPKRLFKINWPLNSSCKKLWKFLYFWPRSSTNFFTNFIFTFLIFWFTTFWIPIITGTIISAYFIVLFLHYGRIVKRSGSLFAKDINFATYRLNTIFKNFCTSWAWNQVCSYHFFTKTCHAVYVLTSF